MSLTFDDYQEIMDERPRKFDAKDVHFHKALPKEPPCASCVHWFRGLNHDVCEIQRPKDEQVPWDWTCMFQTSDGDHFPLYPEQSDENS